MQGASPLPPAALEKEGLRHMFTPLRYSSAQAWRDCPFKRVLLFGMSGLGKTYIANMLRMSGTWYHYSADYRIGTRYLGEAISDNLKKEAMTSPFLANLLRSNSIQIRSNLGFENLEPLSTYLGKPGGATYGGLPMAEYQQRQSAHMSAEKNALLDTGYFIQRSQEVYNYPNFICDTGGSICEIIAPDDPDDLVLTHLAQKCLMIWIKGSEENFQEACARFEKNPKPMCYAPEFLKTQWKKYLQIKNITEDSVIPDNFITHIFRNVFAYRQPIYERMARNWGLTIDADALSELKNAAAFVDLVSDSLKSRGGG